MSATITNKTLYAAESALRYAIAQTKHTLENEPSGPFRVFLEEELARFEEAHEEVKKVRIE